MSKEMELKEIMLLVSRHTWNIPEIYIWYISLYQSGPGPYDILVIYLRYTRDIIPDTCLRYTKDIPEIY